MHHKRNLIGTTTLLLLAAALLPAQADDTAGKGRDIFKKYQRAVVTVQESVKATAAGGRSGEANLEITGTVIDPSGLTVVALSSCDPYELRRRVTPDYKVDSEVSNVRILLEDGELPAEIVLRDRDLDLAFIRPKTKPASPMPAVDLSNAGSAQVLDEIIALNRLNRVVSRAYSASVERITALVQKPRTFYIPDSTLTTTSSGSPAFTADGKVLGVFVMRAITATADSRESPFAAIILPAEDILKGAKQAPEVKPDSDKKEEPKTEPKADTKETKDATEKK
jgi:hypothetical protein